MIKIYIIRKSYNKIHNQGNHKPNDDVRVYIKSDYNYTASITTLNNINMLQITMKLDKRSNLQILVIYISPNTDLHDQIYEFEYLLNLKTTKSQIL